MLGTLHQATSFVSLIPTKLMAFSDISLEQLGHMFQFCTERCITTLAWELHALELHVCAHWFEAVPYVIELNSRVITGRRCSSHVTVWFHVQYVPGPGTPLAPYDG